MSDRGYTDAMDNKESREIKTCYGFILIKKNDGTVCGCFPVFKKEVTFGRDGQCDIKIHLPYVSSQHCSIYYVDNKAYIRDTSTFGSTRVNGKKVGRSNFLLNHSDEIEISGRKFLWEYYKSQNELITEKKNDLASTRLLRRFPNIVNLQSSNLKESVIPSKNIKKIPAKPFVVNSHNTTIIEADTHMSLSSYDKLKNQLNSTENPQSLLMKSHTLVSGVNIPLPLVDVSKSTPRKLWNISHSLNDLSSNSTQIMNRLSNERLMMDSTPEYNCSYHYKDDDIEFDSPVNPCVMLNDDNIDTNTSVIESNNLSNPLTSVNDQVEDDSQSNNVLQDSAFKCSSSKSDSINNGPTVVEENITPAPRRSILKCSTTTGKRLKSSSRMVQFANIPNTDNKFSKISLQSEFNIPVTDDEVNEINISSELKKQTHCNIEEYDEDLDGVLPLDSSVSSLINSSIIDNSSVTKSSIRRSRGNKVISLINSFEKRTNGSPKHSIRASDLLSMSGNTEHNDSLYSNCSLQESTSSAKRVRLEDIFQAEDLLKKNSCNLINEPEIHEVNTSLNSKNNVLHKTNTEEISGDILDKDVSNNTHENEYYFSSPLKFPLQNSIAVTEHGDDSSSSTLNDSKNNENMSDVITDNELYSNKCNVALNVKIDEKTSTNKHSISSEELNVLNVLNVEQKNNEIESSTTVEQKNNEIESSTTVEQKNNEIESSTTVGQKNNEIESSATVEKLEDTDKSVSTDDIKKSISTDADYVNVQNNCLESIDVVNDDQQNNVIEKLDIITNDIIQNVNSVNDSDDDAVVVQNYDLESVDACEDNVNAKNNDIELMNIADEDHVGIKKVDSNLLNNAIDIENDRTYLPKDLTFTVELSDDGSPSLIVHCMSKMFHTNVDDHEVTDSLRKKKVLVKKRGKKKSKKKNVIKKTNIDKLDGKNATCSKTNYSTSTDLNDSLIESIEVQLQKIHSPGTIPVGNEEETSISCDNNTQSENITNTVIDDITSSASNITLSVEGMVESNCSSDVGNLINRNSPTKNQEKSEEKDNSQNPIPNEILIDMDSRHLNIPVESTNNLLNDESKNENNNLFSRVMEENTVSQSSSDNEELDENPEKNVSDYLTDTLNSIMGIPNYESTLRNSSIYYETANRYNASVQPNNTRQRKRSSSISSNSSTSSNNSNNSIYSLPDSDLWSQMMRDFNESVRNASITYYNSVPPQSTNKIVCSDKLNTSKVTTEEGPSSNTTSIYESNTLEMERQNTIQCSTISSCSPKKTLKIPNKYDCNNQLNRNNNKSQIIVTEAENCSADGNNTIYTNIGDKQPTKTTELKQISVKQKYSGSPLIQAKKKKLALKRKTSRSIRSTQSKKLPQETSECEHTIDSSSSSCESVKLINRSSRFPRRQLSDRLKKPMLGKTIQKTSYFPERTSDSESDSQISSNNMATYTQELYEKDTVKDTNKPNRNNSMIELGTVKSKVAEKSTKYIPPIATRITRSNTTLNPNKKISTKNEKLFLTARTTRQNTKKIIQYYQKRFFEPMECDSNSEDKTDSETDDNSQTSKLSKELPKRNTHNIRKAVRSGNNSSAKSNQKGKNVEITPVQPQQKTRGLKRAADTLISKPNSSKSDSSENETDDNSQTSKLSKELPKRNTHNISKAVRSGNNSSAKSNQKEKNIEITPVQQPPKRRGLKRASDTLISKPNSSKSDSSENETEDNSQTSKLSKELPKRNTRNIRKAVRSGNNSSAKSNQKGKNVEITPVQPQQKTRGLKRAADTLISKPNSSKSDSSENETDDNSRTSKLSKELPKRNTHNIRKVVRSGNNSFAKSNQKEKNVEITPVQPHQKKRGLKRAADTLISKPNSSKSDSSENETEDNSQTSKLSKELPKRNTHNISKAVRSGNNSSAKSNQKEKNVEITPVQPQQEKRGLKRAADTLISKPNSSKSDTSENETDDNSRTSKLSKELPIRNTQNISKAVRSGNNSSAKSNQKEKNVEITPVQPQQKTRGLKRAADPLVSQPNSKGLKRDLSSKVASITIARGSSPENLSSDLIVTRNMSKLTVKQKETLKFNKNTQPKICDSTLENSSDDSGSLISKVKFNKNVKTVPPKEVKTRTTEEPTDHINKYLEYSPMKLRVRGKK